MSRKYNPVKVLDCLNELYVQYKEPTKFPITNICRNNQLSTHISKVLVDRGIIKITNNKRPYEYQWNSVEPHLKMAKAVIEETTKLSRFYLLNKKSKFPNNLFHASEVNDQESTNEKTSKLKISDIDISEKGEIQLLRNTLQEKNQTIEILKNEKASLLESMDGNYEAYKKQISELESKLKKVTQYNQNLGEECVGLKFKMEAYEEELLGLKNLKSQILRDCNIQETKFKEKLATYDQLVEKQQEKIELLEERTKGKKYNHLTGWGDGVEEKKASKEYNFLWGMIKIKK
jgi:hypothetical protein